MFKHFLITRFNIRITGAGPEKMTSPMMDERWLRQRLDLFLTYCAPSVAEQTSLNFIWLLYFDPATPAFILEELKKLKSRFDQIDIRYANDYQEMLQDISMQIKTIDQPFAITTRLDNDDLISRDFIGKVQESFTRVHNTIINFNAGYEYSTWDHVLKKWNNRPHNQFISLIEDVSILSVGSVYSFPHWNAPQIGNVINIEGGAYWMYLRHENNYSGQAVRALPVFSKNNLSGFPDVIRNAKLSIPNTFVYTIKWLPMILKSKMKRWTNKV